jgi:hypothetical protein
VPGTAEPRQSGGNPMMMQRPAPKGNMDILWELLGVKIDGQQAAWQEYQPIRQLPQLP